MSGAVGIFGLGLIGIAAASRLIANGHAVVGSDPSGVARASLEAAGGRAVAASDVWAGAEVVLIAVFDAAQAEVVLRGAPEGWAGVVAVLTTCDVAGVETLGQLAAARGIALVEAPVSGTSGQLGRGEAVIFVAGLDAAVDAAVPILGALGRAVHRVGALGNGAKVKLGINLILGLNRAALAEGLVFAKRLGLDPGVFLELARGSAAGSAVMATKGAKMVAEDFTPEGRVAQSAKDFGLILGAAAAEGQDLPFARTYARMMADCIAQGEAGLDNAAIIRALGRCRTASAAGDEDIR